MAERKFQRNERVKITDQSSEFRNMLGTVAGYDESGPRSLVQVKLDFGKRRDALKLFPETALGPTTDDNPIAPFVPD